MDFDLTDEQAAIQRLARDFAQNEVKPVAEELDRTKSFPYELVKQMGALGQCGPKRLGPRAVEGAAPLEGKGAALGGLLRAPGVLAVVGRADPDHPAEAGERGPQGEQGREERQPAPAHRGPQVSARPTGTRSRPHFEKASPMARRPAATSTPRAPRR